LLPVAEIGGQQILFFITELLTRAPQEVFMVAPKRNRNNIIRVSLAAGNLCGEPV
jgi:hypothetical protein